eukprot:m.124985 g.124985  ORF g.124985 m.124985 type:complete len:662 (+) comp23440_c0_seq2:491-2476(+)
MSVTQLAGLVGHLANAFTQYHQRKQQQQQQHLSAYSTTQGDDVADVLIEPDNAVLTATMERLMAAHFDSPNFLNLLIVLARHFIVLQQTHTSLFFQFIALQISEKPASLVNAAFQDPLTVAQCMFVCAKLNLNPNQIAEKLAETTLQNITSFNSQSVTSVAWACGRLHQQLARGNKSVVLLFETLSEYISTMDEQFAAQEISLITWAAARLKLGKLPMFNHIGRILHHRRDEFTRPGFVSLASAMALVGRDPEFVLQHLNLDSNSTTTESFTHLAPHEMVGVVQALVRGRLLTQQQTETLEQVVEHDTRLSLQQVAALVKEIGKTPFLSKSLERTVQARISAGEKMNRRDVCDILSFVASEMGRCQDLTQFAELSRLYRTCTERVIQLRGSTFQPSPQDLVEIVTHAGKFATFATRFSRRVLARRDAQLVEAQMHEINEKFFQRMGQILLARNPATFVTNNLVQILVGFAKAATMTPLVFLYLLRALCDEDHLTPKHRVDAVGAMLSLVSLHPKDAPTIYGKECFALIQQFISQTEAMLMATEDFSGEDDFQFTPRVVTRFAYFAHQLPSIETEALGLAVTLLAAHPELFSADDLRSLCVTVTSSKVDPKQFLIAAEPAVRRIARENKLSRQMWIMFAEAAQVLPPQRRNRYLELGKMCRS